LCTPLWLINGHVAAQEATTFLPPPNELRAKKRRKELRCWALKPNADKTSSIKTVGLTIKQNGNLRFYLRATNRADPSLLDTTPNGAAR